MSLGRHGTSMGAARISWGAVLRLAFWVQGVVAFSFNLSNTSPDECETVRVTFRGGDPPYRLIIIPAYDFPSNISLSNAAYSSAHDYYYYDWNANYPAGTNFVVMMSDANGIGTGGVSPVYRMGVATTNCSYRIAQTDFSFYLNETAVLSCTPVDIYWDTSVTAPVTILGTIPGGQPFVFSGYATKSSMTWNANIASGTQLILSAWDSGKYGTGGSSALLTIGQGSTSCLDESAPSVTTGASTATQTGTPTTSTQSGVKTVTAITTATASSSGSNLSTGAIAGIALAAVFVVLALQGAIFYFCCRRQFLALRDYRRQQKNRNHKSADIDLAASSLRRSNSAHSSEQLSLRTGRGVNSGSPALSPFDDHVTPYDSPIFGPFAHPADRFADGYITPTERVPLDPAYSYMNPQPYQGQYPPPPSQPQSRSASRQMPRPLVLATEREGNESPTSPMSPLHTTTPSTSTSSRFAETKAQTVAALSAREGSSNSRGVPGSRIPRHQAPSGGFRRHEDAGRLDEVEDLPPLYQPEWGTRTEPPNSTPSLHPQPGLSPSSPNVALGAGVQEAGAGTGTFGQERTGREGEHEAERHAH